MNTQESIQYLSRKINKNMTVYEDDPSDIIKIGQLKSAIHATGEQLDLLKRELSRLEAQ